MTEELLKQMLKYEPDTGLFTWLIKRPGVLINDVAGTERKHDGKTYIIISLNGKKHRAHRLAFLYMTGKFPLLLCDHEDGDGTNNRWNNLREVDYINNNRNMRLRADNSSGVAGVYWNKKDKRWQVSLKVGSDRGYIGQYKTLEEAVRIRLDAERKHGFHKNHGQVRPL
tara:strand:- start:522 stop:1028 length:507 start_codon:yes stop_codon:yes gene_type:complete